MSFFSDLFHGNFSNLGEDLSPSNFFKDTGSSAANFFSNPLNDVLLAASVALPFAAPELLGLEGTTALGDASLGTAEAFGASSDAAMTFGGGLGAGAAAFGDPTAEAIAASAGGVPLAGLDPSAYFGADTAAGGGADAILPGASSPTELTGPVSMGADPPNATSATDPNASFPATGTSTAYNAVSPSAGAAADSAAVPLQNSLGGYEGNFATNANPLTNGQGGIMGALQTGGSFLKEAAPYIGVAGLGASLYSGYEQQQALKGLQQQQQQQTQAAQAVQQLDLQTAQPLINSGEMLQSYLANNTLPPQFMSAIQQQVAAQKAGIIQGYATRGGEQSANPLQNSALQQDLANVDQQALTLQANLESTLSQAGNQMITTANSLLSTGLSATQLAAEIPIAMEGLNLQINQQMSASIANFAAAINGGSRNQGVTLNLGGGGTVGNTNLLNPQTGALSL